MTQCVLQFDDIGDSSVFSVHRSVRDAVDEYAGAARALWQFGQRVEAAVYLNTTTPLDYPDYVLSVGPKGGVVKERT